MNPWTFRLCFIAVFLIGILSGIVLSYFLALKGLEVIGTSFQVQSMNVTVQLNQSMLLEAMQDAVNRSSPGNISGIDLGEAMIK